MKSKFAYETEIADDLFSVHKPNISELKKANCISENTKLVYLNIFCCPLRDDSFTSLHFSGLRHSIALLNQEVIIFVLISDHQSSIMAFGTAPTNDLFGTLIS